MASRRRRLSPFVLGIAFASMLTTLFAGCSGEPQRRTSRPADRAQTAANASGDEEFFDAREMLFNLYRFDSDVGGERCALSFNQWLETQAAADWERDSMIDRLPDNYRKTTAIQDLGVLKVKESDIDYMETCVWMRDIVKWIGETEMDAQLESWIDAQEENSEQDRLKLVAKLFDWTTRNLQLRAFAPVDLATSTLPGSQQTVRWTILFGYGDGVERARVFIRLCQQAGVPAVMLATKNNQGQLAPWCPAALLDGKLYLFDTQLGLPIPLENDRGIATLADVRADTELLGRLALGAEFPYPVLADDVKDVTALVDAEPVALSARMDKIEQRLTGDYRLTLTVQPSDLRRELSDLVSSTQLWDLPYHVLRHDALKRSQARKDPRYAAMKLRQEALFVGTDRLITGRKLHLHGQFTIEDNQDGAKQAYMKVRYADEMLDKLPVDRRTQQSFGLVRTSDFRDEEWQRYMLGIQSKLREEKMHASFWIGLIHFEEGNYDSAMQWFGKRVIEENPQSLWVPAARYNLARCYERLGDIREARNIYLADNSVQKHGNLLRARALKSLEPTN